MVSDVGIEGDVMCACVIMCRVDMLREEYIASVICSEK